MTTVGSDKGGKTLLTSVFGNRWEQVTGKAEGGGCLREGVWKGRSFTDVQDDSLGVVADNYLSINKLNTLIPLKTKGIKVLFLLIISPLRATRPTAHSWVQEWVGAIRYFA
jgi:hypothetical protein